MDIFSIVTVVGLIGYIVYKEWATNKQILVLAKLSKAKDPEDVTYLLGAPETTPDTEQKPKLVDLADMPLDAFEKKE